MWLNPRLNSYYHEEENLISLKIPTIDEYFRKMKRGMANGLK